MGLANLKSTMYKLLYIAVKFPLAIAYRRPCLAFAREGNLKSVVQRYNLGVFVEPDNWQAIRDGIEQWLHSSGQPQWQRYEMDNSWEKNAEIVCQQFWGGLA